MNTNNKSTNEVHSEPLQQCNVVGSALSSDDWRRLAGHIDNGFFGSEKTFSAERKNGYYYLNTNKCDDVSMVRVYCKIGVAGIDKIERLGEDTEGWQEIHSNTYKNVEKFLNGMLS
jgi:hypothetical protein